MTSPSAIPAGVTATVPRARMGLRRAVLVLGLLSWLGPFSLDAYSPAFPAIAAEFGVGDSAVQLTLTALVVGLAAGQLVSGPLTDAYGRRRPLLVSLVGYLLASVGCALAADVAALVAARFAQGATVAMALVVARAAGRDLFSGSVLARFYSHIAAVTAVAPAVGPLVGAQLLGVASWRAIFVLVAVLAAGALVLAAVLLPETGGPRLRVPVRTTVGALAGLIRSGPFRAVALTLGLSSAVGLVYLAAAPFVLQGAYGMTATGYSLVFVGNAVTLITAAQVNVRLLRRWSPRRVTRVALAVQLPATGLVLTVLALRLDLAVLLPALAVVIFVHGIVQPNLLTLGMQDQPERAGSAAALLGVAQFVVGGGLAPVLGLWPDAATAMGVVMVALCAAASVALIAVPGRRRRP